ncbi:pyridoxal phosphate-dependent aminotransferase [Thermospira aquatica]|uniref:alanine transaminase n=1 Tax=Thermospira aquatica TaxID=2828656 RepID=A0AAX3BG68_9SPIR|nr:pyridoxal phosphate-dependent aminotransferase [Thermospira aquatica]URA11276.1 pyridoxal phosphate-dependent aminotransferase [Thermospira aquatica]
MQHRVFQKSKKLEGIFYDIRGPVVAEAQRLEQEGYNIIRLNTGNPPRFGVDAPDEIIHDVAYNLREAQGYTHEKGVFSARKAVMQYYQLKGIQDISIDDIYIGNGVSELILLSLQALLDSGDEVLVPIPDYPLWTGAVTLSGGKAIHYICDEEANWYPDLADIRKKITPRTKGIVVINPNNPTGSVYPREILEEIIKIAVEHKLIIFSDEIYEKIVYEDAKAYCIASMTDETLVLTYNGLSKSHRIPGFRVGWLLLSGKKEWATDYIEGLNLVASMRLCSNVPAQYAIQTALGGYQSIDDLVRPGGRLREQRDYSYQLLNDIPGITCVKPMGALYLFPKVDVKRFNIKDDMKLVYDILRTKHILLVQGTGFNWPKPDHFRFVFLPDIKELEEVAGRLKDFFETYKQEE